MAPEAYLLDCLVEMGLASYLARKPAKQIKRMARRFLRGAPPEARQPLQLTLATGDPVRFVRLALHQLEEE